MATAASTLIQRCRRFMGDYGTTDTLSISLSTTATSFTVADSTIYRSGWMVAVDSELLYVKSVPTATVVSVGRGFQGTAAATHVVSSVLTINPAFSDTEILDGLNYALDNCFPYLYKPVAQEYTGLADQTYEYTLPDLTGLATPIPYVYRVEYKESGATDFIERRDWQVIRSATPFLKFDRSLNSGGTLRILGFGPFTRLAAGDSVDGFLPKNCEDLLVLGASELLLASGEARRVRQDVGLPDARENATRTGSSMSASNALMSRFERQLLRKAMPPMPKHVRPTF